MSGTRWRLAMDKLMRAGWVLEAGFWLLFAALFWSLSIFSKIQEYQATGRRVDLLAIFTNEISSAVSALLMLFFVRWWLDRHPLSSARVLFTVAWQALGAVLFSVGHVLVFMVFRSATYWTMGLQYDHATGVGVSGLLRMFAYEFSQDLPLYLGMVLVISMYRRWLARREAVVENPAYPEVILASLGTREKALRLDEVEWIQAAGNYVSLHRQGQEYLLRTTMARLEKTLDPALFQRAHRSYIVNINAIDQVQASKGKLPVLRTRSGAELPLGRNYRAALLQRLSLP